MKAQGRAERGSASGVALGVLAVGYGLAVLTGAHALEAEVALAWPSFRVLSVACVRDAGELCCASGEMAYDRAYRSYAQMLVVSVEVPPRAPKDFGVWPAHDDFYADEAPSDGSIAQWSDAYYVTHNWSEYGKQILLMIPGDRVTVGSVSIQVDGVFDYPDDGRLGQILCVVGDDAVVLQTCDVGIDLTRIVYGHRL